MKSSLLALSLSFLFLALLTKPLLGRSDPLLDLDGDKVEAGSAYYIVSIMIGAGGGDLTLSPNRNGSCPLDVTQHSSDLLRGYPMFFYPINYSSENRGNPGPQTLPNWFKFVKIGVGINAYKIVHCPSDVSESTVHLCSDVGINYVENARRLALSSTQPFRLGFVKAQVLPS
ncbi:hypothetical protein EZV62_019222 [Acer yangbiense]|uniref:Uncharacterized protein n=1 Tax=Acer yangbiense TaxID=1000413 RepID=A0A5C7HCQ1_9ROSI|nr:hypothetical protein EZV62_019222 [Acer yangbiense]